MINRSLKNLDGQVFDVVIIGGGINGASAAQCAAADGFSVLIVEKSDFGSGATSRSSRLLHCGLRYFEAENPMSHFMMHPKQLMTSMRMARQAMEARRDLVRTTPTRTQAMKFLFPVFKNGPYKAWQLDLGFCVLGSLAPKDVPLNYERISKNEAMKNPLISSLSNTDDLLSVGSFTEYQLKWPERICMDSILDAERMGAVVCNYTTAKLGAFDGKSRQIELQSAHEQKETATVRALSVVNMAGLWIDQVSKSAGQKTKRRTFGTKGAHIVVKLADECRGVGIATTNSLNEPFYCIPWNEYHYIGPTETKFDGDFDNISASEEDVDFLLQEANRYFPGLGIDRHRIISTWAGVRPLTFDPALPKGSRSRELHDLSDDGLENVIALTAGPVMTYRSAGQEVSKYLKTLIQPSGSPSAINYQSFEFPENTNTGPLTEAVPSIKTAHLKHCVSNEHAHTLMDVLFRRTGIGWEHKFSDHELDLAASLIGDELNWTEEQKNKEVMRFKAEADELFGIPLETSGTNYAN